MGNAKAGFEMVAKWNRKSTFADCVRVYWERGYTHWQDFKKEYFFMLNTETQEKVRLYYNGRVIEGWDIA